MLVLNSILLIVVRREFNQRKRQLQRELCLKISLVVMMISASISIFQIIQRSAACPRMKLVLTALESVKSQAKPGWQDRVNALQKTRDEAVEINCLGKPGFDPWEG